MTGYEIAFFKLKSGVSEEKLFNATNKMNNNFLLKEEGFLSHQIIKFTNELYADIATAGSKEQAMTLCSKWETSPDALEFLDLIEPIQFEGLEMLNFADVVHDFQHSS
jgi:hypothetical protein